MRKTIAVEILPRDLIVYTNYFAVLNENAYFKTALTKELYPVWSIQFLSAFDLPNPLSHFLPQPWFSENAISPLISSIKWGFSSLSCSGISGVQLGRNSHPQQFPRLGFYICATKKKALNAFH